MKNSNFNPGITITILASAFLLGGCGGTKVLKQPEPIGVSQSLASASDEQISATLDWVIVRDGPGTWAKNADWDEYLIRVQNLGDQPIRVTNVVVMDSLGTRIESRGDRNQLVKGAKQAKRRYRGEGLEVKAGAGAGTLLAAGAVAGAAGAAMVAAAPLTIGGGAAAVAATGVVLLPVLAVGGVVRGVNNSKVNKEIESRTTLLPIVLQEEEKSLDVFFPLSPSPRQIEVSYADSQGDHTLIVDTRTALEGLHLVQAEE